MKINVFIGKVTTVELANHSLMVTLTLVHWDARQVWVIVLVTVLSFSMSKSVLWKCSQKHKVIKKFILSHHRTFATKQYCWTVLATDSSVFCHNHSICCLKWKQIIADIFYFILRSYTVCFYNFQINVVFCFTADYSLVRQYNTNYYFYDYLS